MFVLFKLSETDKRVLVALLLLIVLVFVLIGFIGSVSSLAPAETGEIVTSGELPGTRAA